jgi:hypothetical protein
MKAYLFPRQQLPVSGDDRELHHGRSYGTQVRRRDVEVHRITIYHQKKKPT